MVKLRRSSIEGKSLRRRKRGTGCVFILRKGGGRIEGRLLDGLGFAERPPSKSRV